MWLFQLENNDEIYAVQMLETVEAAYLPNVVYFSQSDLPEGVNINNINTFDDLRSIFTSEEEFEDWISELKYLPPINSGHECEDIIKKEDIEDLERYEIKFIDLSADMIFDTLSDGEFEDIYEWWDGKNWRCAKVVWKKKIKAQELQDKYEEYNTYHYDYWKTPEGFVFRRYVSYYQGELPILDKEWGDADKLIQ